MPYASRRQQRWAFATRQPFAKRWAKETADFAALPEKKDAGTEAGTPLHGPGGLLGTPGIRKWGKRKPSVTTKPMTRSEAARVAALARWGKYAPRPDAPVARGSTFSKQPKPARQAAPKLPKKAASRRGGKKGRAAAQPKKTEHQRQEEQQAKRDQKQREREQAQEAARQQVYERMGIPPEGRAALEALRRGEQPDPEAIARGGFEDAGLIERAADGSYRMTPSGRALTSAADAGDAGRAGDTISGSRDRLSQRRARQAEQVKRRQEAQDRRAKKGGGGKKKQQQPEAKPVSASRLRRLARSQRAIADAVQRAQKRSKSFTVFKDHTGAYRWLSRSTTAYRDRDGEIITVAALEADAARMTATGQYGPLRWWHCGVPNPFDPVAPWGPGIDIGNCDFSIVIGRTSIESGTFKSTAIAEAFAQSADDYELSHGFFHPPDQPNVAGEYDAIRRFERSPVPVKYGRASNLFTGLTVKEARMDPQVYEQRVKAFIAEMQAKGAPPEAVAATLVSMQQADKSAQAQGIAYKSDDAPQVFTAPDGTQGIIHEGRFVALKAAVPAVEEKAPEDVAEVMAMGDGMDGGEFLGDMTPAEFWMQLKNYLAEILAPQAKMDEMAKAFASGLGELKSLYATKDAGTLARIAQLETELARLKGDQPAVSTGDALAALKSSGPQAPPDPNAVQVPDDPNRPFAGLAAHTMPALYSTNPQGGFQGWLPPTPLPPQSS